MLCDCGVGLKGRAGLRCWQNEAVSCKGRSNDFGSGIVGQTKRCIVNLIRGLAESCGVSSFTLSTATARRGQAERPPAAWIATVSSVWASDRG